MICQRSDRGGGIVLINDWVVKLFSKCLFLYSEDSWSFQHWSENLLFAGEVVNIETYNCLHCWEQATACSALDKTFISMSISLYKGSGNIRKGRWEEKRQRCGGNSVKYILDTAWLLYNELNNSYYGYLYTFTRLCQLKILTQMGEGTLSPYS